MYLSDIIQKINNLRKQIDLLEKELAGAQSDLLIYVTQYKEGLTPEVIKQARQALDL